MQIISGSSEVLLNNLYAKVVGYRHQVFVDMFGSFSEATV